MLRLALYRIGIYKDTWFSNLLKCALPENRKSNTDEINNCKQFLSNEINLVDPEYIITLGKHTKDNLPGRIRESNKKIINVYHPAYFLYRNKDYKEYYKHLKEEFNNAGIEI